VKSLTEGFGVNAKSPDGYRNICKACFSENRSGDKQEAVQALRLHEKLVSKAKKALAESLSTLSPGQIQKYEAIVRLAPEHIAKLQKQLLAVRHAEELTQQQAAAAPSLKLVREHFGSPILLTVSEMKEKLSRAKIALANLTDENDAPAREHVEKYIERVGHMVEQHDDLAAEMARDEQELLNEKVCRRVCGRVMDEFLPQVRAAVTADAKVALREKIRARKKALMAMAKTATGVDKSGAERAVVAKAVADALEKLALMCYAAKVELSNDTLVNVQSRADMAAANAEAIERAEAERRAYWETLREQNPDEFEKESRSLVRQVKGDGHFARLQREAARRLVRQDPVEAARIAMLALKPRNVELPNIVYVAMEGKREIWYHPDGRLVKRGDGGEVVYDMRMKAWCMAPAPAGTQLDSPTAKPFQKMEAYQDEFDCDEEGYPKWKYRPEGNAGIHEQQSDGTFKRTDNPSPWTRPEKISFRRAETPASAAHIHLRHGKWFTQADVDKADAADAANPPNLLPPLPRYSVSDSIALPPNREPSPAEIARMNRNPYVWARWEAKQREEKEREAALLEGQS
jgi:hypothetical protein